MRRKFASCLLGMLLLGSGSQAFGWDEYPLFHSSNPLAPRDEWGVLHQMPNVDATDYEHRDGSRWYYYFKSGRELLRDPAYVATLQHRVAQPRILLRANRWHHVGQCFARDRTGAEKLRPAGHRHTDGSGPASLASAVNGRRARGALADRFRDRRVPDRNVIRAGCGYSRIATAL